MMDGDLILSGEEEKTLLAFFNRRATRSFSFKEHVETLETVRSQVCQFTVGDGVLECIEDLKAHGFIDYAQVEQYIKSFGKKKPVKAKEPEDRTRYGRYDNPQREKLREQQENDIVYAAILEETAGVEPRIPEDRDEHRGDGDGGSSFIWVLSLLGLVVGVGAYYLNQVNFGPVTVTPACINEATSRLDDALELGRDLFDSDQIHVVRSFCEELSYDYSDSENLDEPPSHAISIRIQGKDARSIETKFTKFFKFWLGEDCYANHVLEIDLQKEPRNVMTRVNQFLRHVKMGNKDNLGLILFKNCVDETSSKLAMGFKNYLDGKTITVNTDPEVEVSSHGVGFVFLGGSMKNCTKTSQERMEEHDLSIGWEHNVLGRIPFRIKLC